MRIVDVREITQPIASPIRNAYIDFTKMTTSLVAVVTDEKRDGRPVIGYGFNSNGRYGQGGLIRERFAPRLLEAAPESLLDERGLLCPHRAWAAMMSNEKPGGHGERSVAVGTLDMALWDARAKLEEKPLFRLLAERHGREADPRVFVYAAGGYYYPGKDLGGAPRRDAVLSRPRLHGREDEDRRRDDRGGSRADRGGSGRDRRRAAGGRRQWPLRPRDRDRLRQDAARLSAVLVRRGGRPARLRAAGGACGVLSGTDGDRGEPVQPPGRAQPAALRRHAAGSRLAAVRLRALLRVGGYLRTLEALRVAGWSPSRCIPHGGHQMSLNIAAGLGLGGNESYPDLFQPYGGFPDTVRVEDSHIVMPELPGIGFEGKSDLSRVMRQLAA